MQVSESIIILSPYNPLYWVIRTDWLMPDHPSLLFLPDTCTPLEVDGDRNHTLTHPAVLNNWILCKNVSKGMCIE